MNETLLQIADALKAGKRKEARAATEAALRAGHPAEEILSALMLGMDDVGKRFKANLLFVPEVLVAARAMKSCLEVLQPVLTAAGVKPEHTVVIGTVEGDLHDIGKNLVAMMLKGANFNVIDLGINVSAGAFVEAARVQAAKLVALSALLTTTMPAMRTAVAALRASGLPIKVMVGGAPINREFAREIGADGYSPDAASAVDLARTLVAP